MQGYLRVVNMVYWLGIVLWAAALVTAAAAALNVFPAVDGAAVTLAQYAAYPAEEHGRLLAGRIMEAVLCCVDVLQFIAVPLTAGALVAQLAIFGVPIRRASNVIRTGCVVIGALVFSYHATMLAPRMNRELRSYWAAAEAGEVAQAHVHRAAFDRYHPRAEALMRVNLFLVLVAVASSAVAFGTGRAEAGPRLELPNLAGES